MRHGTTLEARLAEAMELSETNAAALAKACGISRPAVSKCLKGNTKNLRLPHLFKVADHCDVDARWLAIGEGEPRSRAQPTINPLANGLSELALRVGRKWQALDAPARTQILMLINTLGALQSESHRKWGIEQQRQAKARKAKEH